MKSFSYRIYYEDTDAGGVVYYANYLKFYERARTDFLRQLNISQSKISQSHDIIFVVSKFDINYLKPAKLDDLIEISVKINKITNFSIDMSQEIRIGSDLINKANVKIASISNSQKNLKPIPEDIINTLKTEL